MVTSKSEMTNHEGPEPPYKVRDLRRDTTSRGLAPTQPKGRVEPPSSGSNRIDGARHSAPLDTWLTCAGAGVLAMIAWFELYHLTSNLLVLLVCYLALMCGMAAAPWSAYQAGSAALVICATTAIAGTILMVAAFWMFYTDHHSTASVIEGPFGLVLFVEALWVAGGVVDRNGARRMLTFGAVGTIFTLIAIFLVGTVAYNTVDTILFVHKGASCESVIPGNEKYLYVGIGPAQPSDPDSSVLPYAAFDASIVRSPMAHSDPIVLTVEYDGLDVATGEIHATLTADMSVAFERKFRSTVKDSQSDHTFSIVEGDNLAVPFVPDHSAADTEIFGGPTLQASLPFTSGSVVTHSDFPLETYGDEERFGIRFANQPINLLNHGRALADDSPQLMRERNYPAVPVEFGYGCGGGGGISDFGIGVSNSQAGQLVDAFLSTVLSQGRPVIVGDRSIEISVSFWHSRPDILFTLLLASLPFSISALVLLRERDEPWATGPVAAIGAAMFVVPTLRLVCVPDGIGPPTQVDELLLATVLATLSAYTIPRAVADWRRIRDKNPLIQR